MTNYDVNQYAAEKTYNNQLPKQGEVIAPFVVTWEQVQYEHMDTRNLKTWTHARWTQSTRRLHDCRSREIQRHDEGLQFHG